MITPTYLTDAPNQLQEPFPAELAEAIRARVASLPEICRNRGVEKLDIFGSALRADFSPESSDLDLVVEFAPVQPGNAMNQYFGLKSDLEAMFGRGVDLVELPAVRSERLREIIQHTRRPLYAAAR